MFELQDLSRRQFLSCLTAAAPLVVSPLLIRRACAGVWEFLREADSLSGDFVLCGAGPIENPRHRPESRSVVIAWFLSTNRLIEITTPLIPHGFSQNPQHKSQFATFPRWGHRAVFLDIVARNKLQPVFAPGRHRFSGHAVFSPAGDRLFASGMNDKTGTGVVFVFDPSTQEITRIWSSYGDYPHELRMSADGRTLIACNSGNADVPDLVGPVSKSNVTWIDGSTGARMRLVEEKNPLKLAQHCAVDREGWVVVVGNRIAASRSSAALPSHVATISPQGTTTPLVPPPDLEKYFTGRSLSVLLLEKQSLAVVTTPKSGRIFVWNYKTGEFVSAFKMDYPLALALSTDGTKLLIGDRTRQRFEIVAAEPLSFETTSKSPIIGATGTHAGCFSLS